MKISIPTFFIGEIFTGQFWVDEPPFDTMRKRGEILCNLTGVRFDYWLDQPESIGRPMLMDMRDRAKTIIYVLNGERLERLLVIAALVETHTLRYVEAIDELNQTYGKTIEIEIGVPGTDRYPDLN